jgi:predicted N-formylglutamate amidohydrolase
VDLTQITSSPLLGANDPDPVGIRNGEACSPFLIICDHAGNAIPAVPGDLDLPRSQLDRHIGIDIGILGVSERLDDHLGAPPVFQRYSRQVIECNRRLHDPELIAAVCDATPIPGNINIDGADRQRRVSEILEPYHHEIVYQLGRQRSHHPATILVSMHSFTPNLLSPPFQRPCHVGLCYGHNDVFSHHVLFSHHILAVLDDEPGLVIGRNEPFGIDMNKNYSVPVYGEEQDWPYVEIEIRQDLIETSAGQAEWAGRLERVLRHAYFGFAGR